MKNPVLSPLHPTLEGHVVINDKPNCTNLEVHLGDAGLSVQENSRFTEIDYDCDCARYKFGGVADVHEGQVKPKLPIDAPSSHWEFSGHS